MKMLIGSGALVVATLALCSCGASQGPGASVSKLPAPLAKRLAAQARATARSLGDPSVKTAQVYGPDSRYVLVKAASGDLVQRLGRERTGFYLIVLHGHFVCHSCSLPPGSKAKVPRGTIATLIWSRSEGVTDSGVGSRSVAMRYLKGPSVIILS